MFSFMRPIHDVLIYIMGNNYTRYCMAHTSFCGLAFDFGQSCAEYYHVKLNPEYVHFWHHNHQLIVTFCVFLAAALWYVDKVVESRHKEAGHTVTHMPCHTRRIRHHR